MSIQDPFEALQQQSEPGAIRQLKWIAEREVGRPGVLTSRDLVLSHSGRALSKESPF